MTVFLSVILITKWPSNLTHPVGRKLNSNLLKCSFAGHDDFVSSFLSCPKISYEFMQY